MIIETCPRCGAPLMDIMLDSYPPIPRKECPSCGWSWRESRSQSSMCRLTETEVVDGETD